MKRLLGALAFGAMALMPGRSSATVVTVEAWAWIDGRDFLYVQSNNVFWRHWDYNIPGREDGHFDPTYISTTLDGVPVLTNYAWYPDWPNGGGYGAFSSAFTGLTPAAPTMDSIFTWEVLAARYSLTLNDGPNSGNGYNAVFDFNDDPPGGASWYGVKMRFEFVPEPSGLLALGVGLAALAKRRR